MKNMLKMRHRKKTVLNLNLQFGARQRELRSYFKMKRKKKKGVKNERIPENIRSDRLWTIPRRRNEVNSIVSYPERGAGGKNTYRGNFSPLLIKDLYEQFKPPEISDYMCGSGTTEDVCNQLHIKSNCYDLNRGFDLVNCEIPERSPMIVFHPPYWDIIKYAGEQYDAEEVIRLYGFDPRSSDLSRTQPWESFLKELDYCIMKQYAALEKGGRMCILVGDIKRQRKLYSMILEMSKPGTIEQIVIKAQHNCFSDKTSYSGKSFIRILHEYMLILRKDASLIFNVQMTKNVRGDLRDLNLPTWKDIVAAVLEENGRQATLSEMYEAVDGHRRTKTNTEWQAKIRQTLQMYPEFQSVSRGVWRLIPSREARVGSNIARKIA